MNILHMQNILNLNRYIHQKYHKIFTDNHIKSTTRYSMNIVKWLWSHSPQSLIVTISTVVAKLPSAHIITNSIDLSLLRRIIESHLRELIASSIPLTKCVRRTNQHRQQPLHYHN